jgi:hypothetical protein
MSDREDGKKTLTDTDIATTHVGRRAALGVLGALGVTIAGCGPRAGGTVGPSRGGSCTDQDPSVPAGGGRGRGITDGDPTDPAGCGSRACTDSDTGDPAGRGRRC